MMMSPAGTTLQTPIPPAHAWLALGAVLLIPAIALHSTTGDLTVYFRYEVLPGQFAYVASKMCALYALVALWLQALLGLGGPSAARVFGVKDSARAHRWLGSVAAVLIVAHVAAFVGAASLREGAFAYRFLWPAFHGFYRSVLSLGAIAFFCVVAAIGAIALWRRGSATTMWVHRLALAGFGLVLAHSYLVGSETRTGMMPFLYLLMIISVVAALGYRAARALRQAHHRQ
jgi:predicted ferric reductase